MSLLASNFTKVRETKQAHEKRRQHSSLYECQVYIVSPPPTPAKRGGFLFANEMNVKKKATGEANSMTWTHI